MGSIQFAVFGVCRSYNIPTIASSALGAAASCVVSVPQDVIKQRLITGVYTHFGEAVTTIFKTEGISGFYSAWRPTMARNVPFVMTTFTTMEFLKRERLSKKEGSAELTLLENVAIGMSSAFVAGLLTQPFDVIKTRMMTQAASTAAPYKSALDCLRTILETEGPLTLYSGLKQRSMYMCLLWGMTFALNGQFESLMLRRRS
jgi:solute carrier family 25 S-adenosylmethionine transporter 26